MSQQPGPAYSTRQLSEMLYVSADPAALLASQAPEARTLVMRVLRTRKIVSIIVMIMLTPLLLILPLATAAFLTMGDGMYAFGIVSGFLCVLVILAMVFGLLALVRTRRLLRRIS